MSSILFIQNSSLISFGIGSTKLDFSKDLKARSLLKNYVMYANHKRLAEFKELYRSEYLELQREYYINSLSN